MERPRCTSCRNPIRQVTEARRGRGDDEWYHPDCWETVRSVEQERYQQQVQAGGLAALLEPYLARGPVTAAPAAPVVELGIVPVVDAPASDDAVDHSEPHRRGA